MFEIRCHCQSVRNSYLALPWGFHHCFRWRNCLIDFKICRTDDILVSHCLSDWLYFEHCGILCLYLLRSFTEDNNIFVKMFLAYTYICPIWGLLRYYPCFEYMTILWVSKPKWAALCCRGEHNVHSLRFPSGATPAP